LGCGPTSASEEEKVLSELFFLVIYLVGWLIEWCMCEQIFDGTEEETKKKKEHTHQRDVWRWR
jgi:hypothetical protein